MQIYLVAMNDTGIVFTPYSYGFGRDPQWSQRGDVLSIPVTRAEDPNSTDELSAFAEVAYKLWVDDVDSMGKSGIMSLWIALRVHSDYDLYSQWTSCGWQRFDADMHEAHGYLRAKKFMETAQARWTLRHLYTPGADPILLLGTS